MYWQINKIAEKARVGKMGTRRLAIVAVVLAALSQPSLCDESGKQPVPTELFGITVGKAYNIGNPEVGDLGDFPVKKFASFQQFLGSGFSYYFEPIKAHSTFEYIEEKKTPDAKFFATSFRAYLYPVIPPNVKSRDELNAMRSSMQYRVAMINWEKKLPKQEDAYYWAMNMCDTFTASFDVTPKITDFSQWYSCTFVSGEREFEVTNYGERVSVSLAIRRDIRDKMDKDIEQLVRKLEGKELLQ